MSAINRVGRPLPSSVVVAFAMAIISYPFHRKRLAAPPKLSDPGCRELQQGCDGLVRCSRG
jgi:hypothetical protein